MFFCEDRGFAEIFTSTISGVHDGVVRKLSEVYSRLDRFSSQTVKKAHTDNESEFFALLRRSNSTDIYIFIYVVRVCFPV